MGNIPLMKAKSNFEIDCSPLGIESQPEQNFKKETKGLKSVI